MSDLRCLDLIDRHSALSATTCDARGGALSGLQIEEHGQTHELLYRGNDWSATEGWTGQAPWLWPVAGRCYHGGAGSPSTEGQYALGSRTFPMLKHGFAKDRIWQTVAVEADQHSARASARLQSQPGDSRFYPFEYTLTRHSKLSEGRLLMTFEVLSSSRNREPMPFNFGCHFTLNLRSWWGNDWLAGWIQGLGQTVHLSDERSLPGAQCTVPRRLSLSHAGLASAMAPAGREPRVCLESPCGERSLSLSFQHSAEASSSLWVTYRDPSGRFFCCEPWVGWPNAINSGRGRVDLEPGDRWNCQIDVELRPSL